mmetsp:Transcript_24751/g.55745  ORF Transcript_24751/g.55745 Transcript_24751/m.55745 type:complete len:227 (+) Transcript_24751:385-1065(+)
MASRTCPTSSARPGRRAAPGAGSWWPRTTPPSWTPLCSRRFSGGPPSPTLLLPTRARHRLPEGPRFPRFRAFCGRPTRGRGPSPRRRLPSSSPRITRPSPPLRACSAGFRSCPGGEPAARRTPRKCGSRPTRRGIFRTCCGWWRRGGPCSCTRRGGSSRRKSSQGTKRGGGGPWTGARASPARACCPSTRASAGSSPTRRALPRWSRWATSASTMSLVLPKETTSS